MAGRWLAENLDNLILRHIQSDQLDLFREPTLPVRIVEFYAADESGDEQNEAKEVIY